MTTPAIPPHPSRSRRKIQPRIAMKSGLVETIQPVVVAWDVRSPFD
jgi:hypothetical protein